MEIVAEEYLLASRILEKDRVLERQYFLFMQIQLAISVGNSVVAPLWNRSL